MNVTLTYDKSIGRRDVDWHQVVLRHDSSTGGKSIGKDCFMCNLPCWASFLLRQLSGPQDKSFRVAKQTGRLAVIGCRG